MKEALSFYRWRSFLRKGILVPFEFYVNRYDVYAYKIIGDTEKTNPWYYTRLILPRTVLFYTSNTKIRAERFYVDAIIEPKTRKKRTSVMHYWEEDGVEYRVGRYVQPLDPFSRDTTSCDAGIHACLNPEHFVYWDLDLAEMKKLKIYKEN